LTPLRRAALVYAVFFTALGSSWAYLPVYYHDLGLGLAEIGLLTAFWAGIQLVAAPVWGLVSDRNPKSSVGLPIAALVAAAGAVAMALTGASPVLPIAVAVMSFGLAGIGPVLDARTLELLGDQSARYPEVRAIGSIVFVFTSVSVGALMDRAGSGSLFYVFVPALLATGVIGLSLPRTGVRSEHSARGSVGAVMGAPGILAFTGGALLLWALITGVNSFYSIQLLALGGSPQLVGVVWGLGAACEVPVMFGHRRLAARFGSGRVLMFGALAYAIRAALATVAPNAAWLVAISPLEGIGYGLLFPACVAFTATRAPRGLAATAQGVLSATIGLASILGSALGGVLAGASSITALFGVSAVGGVVGGVMLAVAARVPAPSDAEAEVVPVPVVAEDLHP
jgi:MFS transporter, PPP family, 3-phenylpropionic acid transporter